MQSRTLSPWPQGLPCLVKSHIRFHLMETLLWSLMLCPFVPRYKK